ncbi:c-type cytochrome [Sphingobium sp. Sx8-8]|uniref:PQQ-dependent sugar dehydrogenase n=1 Tax=Sphingobium sp. Sx8-8 TaxID=2933617 RepID=UPI001F584D9B|nr:c-type cytochrome [Sphingobium sp. Sx8-8]
MPLSPSVRFPLVLALSAACFLLAGCHAESTQPDQVTRSCTGDNGGLSLPPGFCASLFAEGLGHVRHLVVAADGTVYANSQPGNEEGEGGRSGLIVLRDTDSDGRADQVTRPHPSETGGTGIALHGGHVYLEDGDHVQRYPIDPGSHLPVGRGETILSGLATDGDHRSHSIAISPDGALYVNSGSATNACQKSNRQAGSPGNSPCEEKALRAGIWRYEAERQGQNFSPGERYASGIRNAVGLALDGQGRLFATQHGRDQLHENWGSLYDAEQGQNLPAEELVEVTRGSDYGWPECYYDPNRKALVLAPEYGGDGGRALGPCAQRQAPVAAFPAHWAPNALVIYEGNQFPTAYRGGAFIAFHGSWNRAPGPQGGFNIVFQPMKEGRASGAYVLFADGFAGPGKESGNAAHRPSGLAVGPDGALYIGDDKAGRIWKITYMGNAAAAVAEAKPVLAGKAREAPAQKGASGALPPGVSAAMVERGRLIYSGAQGGATCSGCHGPSGQGSEIAPRLSDQQWLWGNGSLAEIRDLIVKGVPKPRRHPAPMPPYGGAQLKPDEVDAVAAYVWSLSHKD